MSTLRISRSLFFVVLSASALFADTISGGTGSFSGKLPFDNSTTTLTGFSQYNGSLPLKAIQFNFVTNVTGTADITDGPGPNGPNPTQDVTMYFSAALSVYDPSNTHVVITSSPAASTLVTVPGDGTVVHASASANGVTTTATLTDSSLFASFLGNGSLALPLGGQATVGFNPALAIPFNVHDSGSASGTVTIDYIAGSTVPEPASASLFMMVGALAVSVGLLRRRRHQSERSSQNNN